MYQVDNAVIMAAGTSSRFAPLSYEKPKSLITVKGEVLIERQIRQLQEVGIRDIMVVVGYQKEKFAYLKEKFGVTLVENDSYLSRNNNASIYAVKDRLRNTYICSSDNYFAENPFESQVEESYYAAVYADGETQEWCLETDEDGYITGAQVGGENRWYMLGHTFWSEKFSEKFVEILDDVYDDPATVDLLWETIYIRHLPELKMKMRKYPDDQIFEFDTLDELREFDLTYWDDTRSSIMKAVARQLSCSEKEMVHIAAYKDGNNAAAGFTFDVGDRQYRYHYADQAIKEI